MLPWNEPKLGCEVPATLELRHVGREGLDRQRRQRPDSRHRLQSPRGIRLVHERVQPLGRQVDPLRLLSNLRQQVLALRNYQRRQIGVGSSNNASIRFR